MTQANEKSATIDRLKSELNDSQQTIDYFHALLQDNKDINLSIVFRVGVCASLFPTNFKLSFITEFMFSVATL
jgi:hypothetical protein